MLIIPLSAVPSQTLAVTLASQYCNINIYQKGDIVFADLFNLNIPVFTTVLVMDRVRLVRENYLGFIGDIMMMDTQIPAGETIGSDPDYTGLGSRWQLCYLEASDLT